MTRRYGSDLLVDLLRDMGIDYLALNPGATLRAPHESIVTYGGNERPEMILCCHEEIAVALAHGYAKTTGRPMAVGLHNVVGLLHASMAIYNAWCDRVPILLVGGTGPMQASRRRPWIDWIHTAQLQGCAVRDYVKWDTQVFGIDGYEPALRRAYQTACLPPQGPVYVCFDVDEMEAETDLRVQHTGSAGTPATGRPAASVVSQVAEWFSQAKHPVILVDFYNPGTDSAAVSNLVKLATDWACPVVDLGSRFNFPNQHVLCLSEARQELLAEADFVLALDVQDLYGAVHSPPDMATRNATSLIGSGCRLVSVSAAMVPRASWAEDYQAWQPVTLAVHVTGAAFVESLYEHLGSVAPPAWIEQRRADLAALRQQLEARWRSELEARWDQVPISTGRLAAEVWEALRDEDWVLANGNLSGWTNRLWTFETSRPHLGGSGGAGLGYGPGAGLGAALAVRDTGKIAVNLQADGDLMYTPSALWTAAHHRLPVLFILHNNRSYYQDELHQAAVAAARHRPDESKRVAIRLENPPIDFASLARSMGVAAAGPVMDPTELKAHLKTAVQHVVSRREPFLLDVVCQPR